MNGVFKSFPLAFKMIFKDPVNLILAIIPTALALCLYVFTINIILHNVDTFKAFLSEHAYTSDNSTVLAWIMTGLLVVFAFFVMWWTFILLVGIIAAPFNSMLSARIEKKLVQHIENGDKKEAFEKIGQGLVQTFKNEFKKIFLIVILGAIAMVFNFIPFFYPIGILLMAILLGVQFLDYSWSRHNMHFGSCLKDVTKNIIPYSVAGFFFLLLATVPIINAFVPALATSYFTVLWLHRQNKI